MEKKLENLKSIVQKNKEELEIMKQSNLGTTYNIIRLYVLGERVNFTLELFDENMNLKYIYPTIEQYMNPMVQQSYNKNRHRHNHFSNHQNNTRYDEKNEKKKSKEKDDSIYCCYETNRKIYDINFEKMIQRGIKYILLTISNGDNIKFGWMERRVLNSSEIFHPETHHQNFIFNYEKDTCPLILDCETREFVWIDQTLTYNYYKDNNFTKIQEYLQLLKENQELENNDNNNNNNSNNIMDIYDDDDDYQMLYHGRGIARGVARGIARGVARGIGRGIGKGRGRGRGRGRGGSDNSFIDEEILLGKKNLYHRNLNVKQSFLYFYLEPLKISIGNLIQLHIQARNGTLVNTQEELQEGDTAFLSTTPYFKKPNVNYIIACQQLETILSNYMI
ncbi:hypothetical protein BCR32DRAFT_269553 [Anaeromyces robustus]|uniref:Uncharacterized protein n=1 Tax=Anaeromyces robustus TaxID=1754192 RepID=A0A1Y1X0E7_9FUNG|nr:hypothetical protein BCR32DRAFT_269553 [Anaeromyces robustus]|eukprot:ORX79291.1 hypothetical protein BCR32DRAFT_269553 [Anaeromyces robustus]